jgi:hypothetical protein
MNDTQFEEITEETVLNYETTETLSMEMAAAVTDLRLNSTEHALGEALQAKILAFEVRYLSQSLLNTITQQGYSLSF